MVGSLCRAHRDKSLFIHRTILLMSLGAKKRMAYYSLR